MRGMIDVRMPAFGRRRAYPVIPAKAGIQARRTDPLTAWTPAFAGVTV